MIYRFNAIPIKIPALYFVDINKLILKFIWRHHAQKKQNSQYNIEEEQSWRTNTPDFKTYYKVSLTYSNQDSVTLVKEYTNTSMEENSPEIDPCKYSQLIFDKGAKAIQFRKIVFSTNGAGKTGQLHGKE